jgi:hypothetical protein
LAANGVNDSHIADGSLSPAKIVGTAATLGSNSFLGNQSITGSLNVSAGITIDNVLQLNNIGGCAAGIGVVVPLNCSNYMLWARAREALL